MASLDSKQRKPNNLKLCTREALVWKVSRPAHSPQADKEPHALNLVEFLRNRENGLELLTGFPYYLNLRRHYKHKHLVLFHYQQTVSNLNNPIVREARGTVLDQHMNWTPVCLPYLKFDNFTAQEFPQLLEPSSPLEFKPPKEAASSTKKGAKRSEKAENWLEKKAASQSGCPKNNKPTTLNWETDVTVYEKFDGTLINLYFAHGEFHVGTSNFPCGSNPVFGSKGASSSSSSSSSSSFSSSPSPSPTSTFAELFWSVWKDCGYPPKHTLPTNYCLMFELLTPETRVVVPLKGRRLILHGVRNMHTLVEENPSVLGKKLGLVTAQPLAFTSMEHVLATAQSLPPTRGEGFVVLFGKGGSNNNSMQRCKVKGPAYVATALLPKSAQGWERAVGGDTGTASSSCQKLNNARLLEIAKIGESPEFSAAFPLVAPRLEKVVVLWERFVKDCEETYFRFFGGGGTSGISAGEEGGGGGGMDVRERSVVVGKENQGEIWKRAAAEGVDRFVMGTLMAVHRDEGNGAGVGGGVRSAFIRVESKKLAALVFKHKRETATGDDGGAGTADSRLGGAAATKHSRKPASAELSLEEKAEELMLQLIAEEEEEEEEEANKQKAAKNQKSRGLKI